MSSVEYKFENVIERFKNYDNIEMIIWARKTIEQIAKEIHKKEFPYRNIKTKELAFLLKQLEKEELIPERLLPHFRVIQTFGNYIAHERNIKNNEMTDEEIVPVHVSLKFIMKWYREESRPELGRKSLAELSINSYYYKDLKVLEENNFDESSLFNENVMFIVIGSSIMAELLDRPLAGILRDEINKKYPLRAIVLSDLYYLSNKGIQDRLVISIGNPKTNRLSKELFRSQSEEEFPDYWLKDEINGQPKVVVWGSNHQQIQSIIFAMMEDDNGLKKILKNIIDKMDDETKEIMEL